MVQPTFRLASPADAYEMAVMSRYLVEVGLRGWSWPPERVAKAIRSKSTLVVVAEVRQHLVGFAIMEFGDVQAHLSLLAVKPSHQRCGIGRALYRLIGFGEGSYIPGYYRGVETALRMSRDIRRHIPDPIK